MSTKWVAKRKTVNLSEKALEALEKLAQETGYTETRIINDALEEAAKRKLLMRGQG